MNLKEGIDRSGRKWKCQAEGCDNGGIQTAGAPLRKWCSEKCRKTKYDLACVDCGGRVSGTTPGKMANRAEPRCIGCAARVSGAARKVWTRDAVAAAMREWHEVYGEAPAQADWCPYFARGYGDDARAVRFEDADGHWPSFMAVVNEFGSWNAAVVAAGFAPRPQYGVPVNQARRRDRRIAA